METFCEVVIEIVIFMKLLVAIIKDINKPTLEERLGSLLATITLTVITVYLLIGAGTFK